jgi:hypothetical protein
MPLPLPLPVITAFAALSATEQEDAKAIVIRHLKACRKQGVLVEYLDRVWLEAIEEVTLARKRTVVEAAPPLPADAVYHCRRYRVYDAPRT